MFIVSHYTASRLTVSNNEFDGTTSTSASCNGNHYWTMMFYGDGKLFESFPTAMSISDTA